MEKITVNRPLSQETDQKLLDALATVKNDPRLLVLEMLPEEPIVDSIQGEPVETFIGLVVDTETTGADVSKDIVFQLAYIQFRYDAQGRVHEILDSYSGLQDPKVPLTPEIQRITGFKDEDLAGQSWDDDRINAAFAGSQVLIAHNARFDAPMCNRFFPGSHGKEWACSMADVRWNEVFQTGSAKLEYLLFKLCNVFYRAHNAMVDVRATLHLLQNARDTQGVNALAMAHASSRRTGLRVYATNSNYDNKDVLKEDGYKWFEGSDAIYKSWFKEIEIGTGLLGALDFLWDVGYGRSASAKVSTVKVDAVNRYLPSNSDYAGTVKSAKLVDLIASSKTRLQELGLLTATVATDEVHETPATVATVATGCAMPESLESIPSVVKPEPFSGSSQAEPLTDDLQGDLDFWDLSKALVLPSGTDDAKQATTAQGSLL